MLCRVCLLEASEILAIFEDLGEQFRIAELIKQHLLFKPDANDNITTHICVVCWDMIKDFHKFYKNVEKAQKQYEEIVRKVANTKSLEEIEVKEELERPNCSSRIKEENNIDDAFDEKIMQMDIESQENTLVGHKANTEQHNPLEYLNEESEFDCDDTSGQDEDDYEPSDISEPLESQNDEPELRDSEKKLKGFRKKRKSLEGCSESEKITKKTAKKDKEKKQRIYINKTDPAVTDTLIEKHIPMGCQLCVFVGKQFADIVEHFRKSHPKTRPFITCCDKRFTKRFYVAQHALKHEDPNCFSCIECNKAFSTHRGLRTHNSTFHATEEELIFACDQCPKRFARRNLLEMHKPSHIPKDQWSFVCSVCPERNACDACKKIFTTTCGLRAHNMSYHPKEEECIYVCDQCPKKFSKSNLLDWHKVSHIPKEEWSYFCTICPEKKAFASDHLLQSHTITQHRNPANICHVCAKVIKDKKSFEKHVQSHFNLGGPRIKCPYDDCESWLKDEDNLKKHLRRHNPEGIVYKCPDCEKVCKNLSALRNHKNYSHSNKIFTCDHCMKTFKRAITLREHMAQHTGETLYKCPFCTRTFNSNANMHAHKKRDHPIEWDSWRRSKQGTSQAILSNADT